MSTLFKYIIKEILKQFALIATIVIVVYITIDFLDKIEKIMKAGLPISELFIFFLLRIPLVIVQITPGAILIATLIVFGLMKRNNEITALKSGGLGIRALLKPAVVTGGGFCIILFVLSEIVVPSTISQANLIWLKKVRHKASTAVKRNDIWIKDSHVIMHIDYYIPEKKIAHGITVNFFDKPFQLVRRVDAWSAEYGESGWVLTGALDNRFDENGDLTQSSVSERLRVDLDIGPEDIGRAAKSSEEMGFFELLKHIHKIAAEGYGTTSFQVDLQAKIAFPFVCLLMSLVGTGLGASGRAMGGIAATIAYGIGISFAYMMLYGFSLSLGYGGFLPPIIAAWSTNIIFFVLAGALLAKSG